MYFKIGLALMIVLSDSIEGRQNGKLAFFCATGKHIPRKVD